MSDDKLATAEATHAENKQGVGRTALKPALERFENRIAAGYVKVAGKHVAADGLFSRRGYRRVVRDGPDITWFEDRRERVLELSDGLFRGRNATIFEGRVLAPLRGERRRTIAELAEQFNVPQKRIYTVEEEGRARIKAILDKKKTAALDIESIADPIGNCATCGRAYFFGGWTCCARGYGSAVEHSLPPHIHPECLPPHIRAATIAHAERWRRCCSVAHHTAEVEGELMRIDPAAVAEVRDWVRRCPWYHWPNLRFLLEVRLQEKKMREKTKGRGKTPT